MDRDNRQSDEDRSDSAPHKKSQRTYSFLLRLSRRLGNIATYSSFMHDVKNFLSQEISLPSSANILNTPFQRQSRSASKEEKQDAKAQELREIVERSHEILMSANTVFPITLFPDTVTVDRTKVTIAKRDFFWSSDVMSIRIEDVLNVSASVGPLFGSLTVASRVMSTIDHFKIDHFWRNDAIKLKHIIQGYVIAQHNKIDTAHLNRKELIDTLIELGNDSSK